MSIIFKLTIKITINAAWNHNSKDKPKKGSKLKYGTVPHIGFEFFGLGI